MGNSKGCIVALCVVFLTLRTLVLHADGARAGGAVPAAGGADGAPAAAGGGGGNNAYCALAFDKVRCEKVTKTATDWDQAMTLVLKDASKHCENVIRESKKETTLSDTPCAETYTNIQARLKECVDLVSKADKSDEVNFKISAAITGLEDCKNKLQDDRDDETPFYALNRHFNHALKICLAVDKARHEAQ
ncbi:PREDICTED: uncharacterized protein LOC109156039 [Ipomoea nil]|uniref:uncharacterized protein LOC109156039 n=1 Tax=Ipomoea nil TaxID=35883 RepID=UPI0009009F24|nr:PREDICTED: uncharacterized protein LOC109156039 [Ipomoea nil]